MADGNTSTKDFEQQSTMSSPTRNAHFDLEAEAGLPRRPLQTQSEATGVDSPPSNTPSPILKRSRTRSNTVKTFHSIDASTTRPNWHPGQEPGLDPSKPNGGRAQTPTLHEECQITVVDFSEDDMVMHDFGNQELIS